MISSSECRRPCLMSSSASSIPSTLSSLSGSQSIARFVNRATTELYDSRGRAFQIRQQVLHSGFYADRCGGCHIVHYRFLHIIVLSGSWTQGHKNPLQRCLLSVSILRHARRQSHLMWYCMVVSMRWNAQARSAGLGIRAGLPRLGSLTRRLSSQRATRIRCGSSLRRSIR